MLSHAITAAALLVIPGTLAYVTDVDPVHPPHQTEEGQYGYNELVQNYRHRQCV